MKGEYSRNIHTTDWQTLLEIVFTFSCKLKYLSKFIFFYVMPHDTWVFSVTEGRHELSIYEDHN